LPESQVTIAIPTLTASTVLQECLAALERQTYRDFEAVIIDNSGKGLVREMAAAWHGVTVIENSWNMGFGAAANQALRRSTAPYFATLNDDAIPGPEWLGALVRAMESRPGVGMCASAIRLPGASELDSAGMLISGDATSKQRGHLQPPERYSTQEEVLCPSGCAALYRREMLDQIGLFDEDFFLYCEDTDLGLRGRWAGWKCLYAPDAAVEHRYSQTAGADSWVKAYFVERNRLFVLLKDFPLGMVVRAPAISIARYFWHVASAAAGRGSAARFRQRNSSFLELVYIVLRAHFVLLKHGPRLLRQRRQVRRTARMGPREFAQLVAAHFISPREVAEL
jgi:GT2 family glycosyltransferase